MSVRSNPFRSAVVLATAVVLAALAPVAAAQNRAAGLPDFTELYEKQSPAVVSIDVTQKLKRHPFPELSEDDPFYEFFRRFGQVPRHGAPGRDLEQQSVGSGFIISATATSSPTRTSSTAPTRSA